MVTLGKWQEFPVQPDCSSDIIGTLSEHGNELSATSVPVNDWSHRDRIVPTTRWARVSLFPPVLKLFNRRKVCISVFVEFSMSSTVVSGDMGRDVPDVTSESISKSKTQNYAANKLDNRK